MPMFQLTSLTLQVTVNDLGIMFQHHWQVKSMDDRAVILNVFCQWIVIGANSMPPRISNVEHGEGGDCIQCKHLSCDTTQLQNITAVDRHGCAAALGPLSS